MPYTTRAGAYVPAPTGCVGGPCSACRAARSAAYDALTRRGSNRLPAGRRGRGAACLRRVLRRRRGDRRGAHPAAAPRR